MIDFLEQHGFVYTNRYYAEYGVPYLVQNSQVGIVAWIDSLENEIKHVDLVIPVCLVVDCDDADRFINIRVPNCDNKLALYTLLHNFDLLPK